MAEELDDRMARVHLLDVAVECPVRAHCAANCFCERVAISAVTMIEAGTTKSEMSASNGLIETIRISTPITVKSDVISWVRVCWSVWLMLSMSLVTRDRMSPRDSRSKYASGSRPSFLVDPLAQPVDGALRDAGHDVGWPTRRPS